MKKNITFKVIEVNGINSVEKAIHASIEGTSEFPKYLSLNETGELSFIPVEGASVQPSVSNTEEITSFKEKIASLEQTIKSMAKSISTLDTKLKNLEKGAEAPKK